MFTVILGYSLIIPVGIGAVLAYILETNNKKKNEVESFCIKILSSLIVLCFLANIFLSYTIINWGEISQFLKFFLNFILAGLMTISPLIISRFVCAIWIRKKFKNYK